MHYIFILYLFLYKLLYTIISFIDTVIHLNQRNLCTVCISAHNGISNIVYFPKIGNYNLCLKVPG